MLSSIAGACTCTCSSLFFSWKTKLQLVQRMYHTSLQCMSVSNFNNCFGTKLNVINMSFMDESEKLINPWMGPSWELNPNPPSYYWGANATKPLGALGKGMEDMLFITGRKVEFPELLRIRKCQGQGKFPGEDGRVQSKFRVLLYICSVLYPPNQEICPVIGISLSSKVQEIHFSSIDGWHDCLVFLNPILTKVYHL